MILFHNTYNNTLYHLSILYGLMILEMSKLQLLFKLKYVILTLNVILTSLIYFALNLIYFLFILICDSITVDVCLMTIKR